MNRKRCEQYARALERYYLIYSQLHSETEAPMTFEQLANVVNATAGDVAETLRAFSLAIQARLPHCLRYRFAADGVGVVLYQAPYAVTCK